MTKLIIMTLSLALTSCATIHKANFAKQVNKKKVQSTKNRRMYERTKFGDKNKTDSGLVISYEWNDTYEDKYFKNLAFTFENRSNEWKKIEKIGVEFGEGTNSKEIFFLSGAPLASFLKAKELSIAVDAKNKAALVGALAGISASANSSVNNDYSNYSAGIVAMSAATSVLRGVEGQLNHFPEEHLFGSKERFLIPPNLAITKYLVFYTKNEKNFDSFDKLYISYELKDGTKEKLELQIGSMWNRRR